MFTLVLSLFLVRTIILSTDYNPREIWKQMRIKNATTIIISHLNTNSIHNKFDCLTYLIDKNQNWTVYFLIASSLFMVFIYPIEMTGMTKGGGGGRLLLYVRDHIPSRKRKIDFCSKIESIVVEINLNKKKWLITHNPKKSMISNHLITMTANFDLLHKKHE